MEADEEEDKGIFKKNYDRFSLVEAERGVK